MALTSPVPAPVLQLLQAVEPKVYAGGGGSGLGGVADFLLEYYHVFKGVPEPVPALVYIAVPAVLSLMAGWLKKGRHPAAPAPAAAPPAAL